MNNSKQLVQSLLVTAVILLFAPLALKFAGYKPSPLLTLVSYRFICASAGAAMTYYVNENDK